MADIYIGNVKGPQGDTGATGATGAQGDAATIQVGTVSTTAYGNPAQVVNSGTEHAAVLNFTIPQGAPGATVTQLDNLALNTITTSTDQYPQIQVGDIGRVIFGKIIKFFQDLVTGLAAKVNYSDALTMEEIEAASDLTDKVSAAAASKTLKDALTTYTPITMTVDPTHINSNSSTCYRFGRLVFVNLCFQAKNEGWGTNDALFSGLPKPISIARGVAVRGQTGQAAAELKLYMAGTDNVIRSDGGQTAVSAWYSGLLIYVTES